MHTHEYEYLNTYMYMHVHRNKHKIQICTCMQAHTNTYKAVEITGIWWSYIYRVTNNEQRPKVLINWVSRSAVTSLTLPVA